MLDTLDYSEALVDAGVPPDQARLQAKALSEALESNDLATKADIAKLEATTSAYISRLAADIAKLEATTSANLKSAAADLRSEMAGMRTDIANMETRIIKWQVGGIGVLAAIMKFL